MTTCHDRFYRAMGVFLFLSVASLPASPATAGELTIQPSIEVRETYTDNVLLDATATQDEFVTTINPGINVLGEGRRLTFFLNYSPEYLYFPGLNEDQFRHDLQATLNGEVVRNLFFVDAQAVVAERFFDRGGDFAFSDANLSENRRTVQTYNVSPYIQTRLEQFAVLELRYRLNYFNADEVTPNNQTFFGISDSVGHLASATLQSGPQFRDLSWSLRGSMNRVNRKGPERDFDEDSVFASFAYRLNRWVGLTGGVGYERTNLLNIVGDSHGVIWDAGVDLTPGPKTQINVRYGQRIRNDVFSARLVYDAGEGLFLNAGYTDTFQTTQDVFSALLSGLTIGDNGQLLGPDGLPFDFNTDGFSLTNQNFRQQRVQAGMQVNRRRTTLTVTGYYEQRTFDTPTRTTDDGWGGQADILYRFSRRASAQLIGGYRGLGYGVASRNDDIYYARFQFNLQLTRRLTAYASYTRTDRNSDVAGAGLAENSVTVALRAAF